MSKKTKKLKCIVTGRVLVATNDYYAKKLERAGDEELLHKTYICKEAKRLLLKGYDVDTTRNMLDITDDTLGNVPDEVIQSLGKESKYIKTTTTGMNFNIVNARTDPLLEDLLNNLRHE